MRFNFPQDNPSAANADFLRRHARRLLRDVHSGQPSKALPVLRRVCAASILPSARLTDLYHARESVRLKHLLRMLAAELGYPSWEACKHDVGCRSSTLLDRFRLDVGGFADFHHIWFANAAAAQQWQAENGGRLVVYGRQALVLTG